MHKLSWISFDDRGRDLGHDTYQILFDESCNILPLIKEATYASDVAHWWDTLADWLGGYLEFKYWELIGTFYGLAGDWQFPADGMLAIY